MTTPIDAGRFAVFDFETTGLDAGPQGRVLEVGVVELNAVRTTEDGQERLVFTPVREWETLIDPGDGVGVGATHIHGIQAAHVVGAPTFAEIAGDLLSRLDDAIIVAHNAAFDLAFLHYECALADIDLPQLATVCTRDLARALWEHETRGTRSPRPRFTLTACCERADIPFAESDQHRSLGDVRVTAQLLNHLVARADALDLVIGTATNRARIDAPAPSGRSQRRPGLDASQMSLDFTTQEPTDGFGIG